MHIPDRFAWTDIEQQLALMRAHPFATLVTTGAGGPEAQHIPLLAERSGERIVLSGHVARGSPAWRASSALAVFTGAHAYISAGWYGEDDTVPTWNYLAVHASGPLHVVEDPAEVRALFERLGEALEGAEAAAWWARLSDTAFARMAAAIVWFRIEVAVIDGKAKLSQHHPPERRHRAIAALRTHGGDDRLAIATAMERTLPEPA